MRSFFTALIPCLLLAGSISAQHCDESVFQTLKDSLIKIMEKNKIPGVQVAITNRDSVLYMANLGLADVHDSIPVTSETMFRIGSISKSFTAASIMMLVEDGIVNLDDAIAGLIPEIEFRNRWEATDPVRIGNLLEHTSGFDDIHIIEYATQADGWTTRQCLDFHPDSRTSRWRPGMHMSYCNSGPVVAAYVVEKMTGMPLEDYVRECIFTPLGMVYSDYFPSEYVLQHLAKGYTGEDMKEAPYWHILGRPSGAINSTATEMAAYVRFYLNRGSVDSIQLLDPASIDRMEHPRTTLAAKAGVTEGYGLNIGTDYYKGVKVCGHNGGMNGFLSGMGYMPELGVGYIFSMNSDGEGFGELERTIMSALIPDSLVRTAADMAVEGTTIDPAMFGWYRSATSRQQITAFVQKILDVVHIRANDTQYLYQPLFEPTYTVYPINEHTLMFETEKHNFTPMVYIKDTDNTEYLQTPCFSGNYIKKSGFVIWFNVILTGVCLALMASSILAALIWIPVRLIRRKPFRFMVARVLPLFAVIFLGIAVILFIQGMNGDMMENFGGITIFSLGFTVFTILFVAFTGLGLLASLFSFGRPMNRAARVHAMLVTLACVVVSVYLLLEGIIGLRTWAY